MGERNTLSHVICRASGGGVSRELHVSMWKNCCRVGTKEGCCRQRDDGWKKGWMSRGGQNADGCASGEWRKAWTENRFFGTLTAYICVSSGKYRGCPLGLKRAGTALFSPLLSGGPPFKPQWANIKTYFVNITTLDHRNALHMHSILITLSAYMTLRQSVTEL